MPGATTRVIDYAELAWLTDSFASALLGLGVRRGDTVAVQLPCWWELMPLGLACAWVGARFCPLMTIYRRYELEHILRLTGARVCITVTEWGGVKLAEIVTGLADQLPQLEHVLIADPVADTLAASRRPAGTLSFADHFPDAPQAGAGGLGDDGTAGSIACRYGSRPRPFPAVPTARPSAAEPRRRLHTTSPGPPWPR